jgi:hypothetical protein
MVVQRFSKQMAHHCNFSISNYLVADENVRSIFDNQEKEERIMKMKNYIIKKGRHYPVGFHFRKYNGGDLVIFGRFDLNCWHYPDDIPASGKNKLTGITWGFNGVHKNSIRIAWQPDKIQNKINLYIYYYNQGIKFVKPVGSVNVGQEFMIRLIFGNNSFKVRFRDFEKKYAFKYPKTIIRYFNFPYFGGESKAPWDMNVFMKMQETI